MHGKPHPPSCLTKSSAVLAEADRSCRRDVRDLRLQCQRLSKSNEQLKSAADAGRVEAFESRRRADIVQRELEAERKSGAELRRVRNGLQAAASDNKKSLARLQAQLCKGAPSSRLLDRARCLKQTVEKLEGQSNAQAIALSARTAELEGSKREARALAAALGARTGKLSPGCDVKGPITTDELLEMGRAKLMNHDLALGMARLSETSETLAIDNQKLKENLSKEAAEVKRCHAEITELRGGFEKERGVAEGLRAEAAVANASTREARELAEALRAREQELLKDVAKAGSQNEELERKLTALATAVERGEAMGTRAERLQTELHACKATLSTEKQRREQVSTQLRASKDSVHRTRQRLEALEGIERERQRLGDLLKNEGAIQTTLRGDVAAAREELRISVVERGELLRGLRQAKVFNDELAKGKATAEQREREACARCADIREGKLALQKALLEQLSVSRAELRDERARCQRAEATLSRLAEEARARSKNRALPRLENNGIDLDDDDEDGLYSFEASKQSGGSSGGGKHPAAASSPQPIRPRDTLVQDYLGKEGAEQFLSDWDEERSSTSSLFSSPPSDDDGDDGDDGDAGAALERSKRVQPRPPSPSPPPTPLLPPGGRSSMMDGSPPALSPGRQHADPPERRPEQLVAALTTTCLDDFSLETWASSMVALGKATRVEAGAGAGAGHEVTVKGLGVDLAAVFAATTEPRPASESPGIRDSSPSGSHCSSRAFGGDGNSSVPQVNRQSEHQRPDRQRLGQGYRALSPPALSQERKEGIESAEGDALCHFPVPPRSPPRTSASQGSADGLADGGVEATATSRVAETPMLAGSSSSRWCGSEMNEACGGRDDCVGTSGGRGDGGGVSVRVGAGVGARKEGSCLGKKVCADEDESVAAEKNVAMAGVEPRSPPRRSLLDLADQSIDEI